MWMLLVVRKLVRPQDSVWHEPYGEYLTAR